MKQALEILGDLIKTHKEKPTFELSEFDQGVNEGLILARHAILNEKVDWNNEEDSNEGLNEICANCGLILGLHHAGTSSYPNNYCPGPSGKMDWANGPGTCFKPTGKYEKENI